MDRVTTTTTTNLFSSPSHVEQIRMRYVQSPSLALLLGRPVVLGVHVHDVGGCGRGDDDYDYVDGSEDVRPHSMIPPPSLNPNRSTPHLKTRQISWVCGIYNRLARKVESYPYLVLKERTF
jgi:hypothetical protein